MPYQVGITLIEILVSFTILAIVLLGFDAMQIHALREAKAAYYFCVATQQLNNMVERLKVLKRHSINEQVSQWNQQNAIVLPQGLGIIKGSYPDFTIRIAWGSLKTPLCNDSLAKRNKMDQTGCLQLSIKI